MSALTPSSCPTADRAPKLLLQHVPEPKTVKNRVDLAVAPGDDPMAEIDRLIGLGAKRVGALPMSARRSKRSSLETTSHLTIPRSA
jgi:hypothetical protein